MRRFLQKGRSVEALYFNADIRMASAGSKMPTRHARLPAGGKCSRSCNASRRSKTVCDDFCRRVGVLKP